MWKRDKKTPATRDRGGRIALHYAAVDARGAVGVDRVRELLAQGQDPNDRDYAGFTPLHGSAQFDSVETVRALLDAGAAVNAVDDQGNTALEYAVRSPWTTPQVVQLLRDRGGDPTIANHLGQTPLGRVAAVDNKPLIRAVFADLLGGPNAGSTTPPGNSHQ
ncbi:ankyrin repeat domain-containing protein [Nocardia sp. NPDC058658]|uniref:ankyrin repeat domain-containing protein n=1 Tax=Nocardia sp. NPDC058658 TaxID=3346580 RepID=UPI0036530637